MANGSMLQELRKILESSKTISAATATRLTLSALTEVMQTQKDDQGEIKALLCEIKIDVEKNRRDIQATLSNPMVRVGMFIREHPRIFWTLFVLLGLVVIVPHAHDILLWWPVALEALFGVKIPPGGVK